MEATTTPPLLKIPVELRLVIYMYILPHLSGPENYSVQTLKDLSSVLGICRQVRTEASKPYAMYLRAVHAYLLGEADQNKAKYQLDESDVAAWKQYTTAWNRAHYVWLLRVGVRKQSEDGLAESERAGIRKEVGIKG